MYSAKWSLLLIKTILLDVTSCNLEPNKQNCLKSHQCVHSHQDEQLVALQTFLALALCCPREVLIYLFLQLSWHMNCLGVCSSGKCKGKVTRLVGNSTSCRGQLDSTFFKPHLCQPYSMQMVYLVVLLSFIISQYISGKKGL